MAAEPAFGGLGASQRGPSYHPEGCSHQVRAASFCPPDGLKRQIVKMFPSGNKFAVFTIIPENIPARDIYVQRLVSPC